MLKRATAPALLAALAIVAIPPAGASAANSLAVHGSVNQVYVTGAQAGTSLRLVRKGKVVSKKPVGTLGGVVFRGVPAGKGYRVRAADGSLSVRVGVMRDRAAPKNTSIYNQTLPAGGYGYMYTRDGTILALDVRLPGPPEDGPYPTVVEYSGYGYARPSGAQSGISPLLNLLGYAVVDVNMRGTGCSGGAFDYFERLQSLDGYDVVETAARQPWVLHNRVGMAGVSYGGISQLFVGATRPPHLAAITPLSVIDNTATTLYPGGILNTGFAVQWALDRQDDAKPASPSEGQAWAWQRIQDGDQICKANQVLHTAAANLTGRIRNNNVYRPKVADPLSPSTFVKRIGVPVFMACQFEDEQTGGHCANLANRFTGTRKKWFTFANGLHVDSLDPETFNRWFDFLELYVAERRPQLPPLAAAAAPSIYQEVMGIPGVALPPDPIQNQPSYEAALNLFQGQPSIRVLFDNGAGGAPGVPYPGFERFFNRFPIPKTKPRSWFFRPNGLMTPKPARKGGKGGSTSFTWDRAARPATDFAGSDTGSGDLWTAHPSFDWRQPPAGTAASFVTPPLGRDAAIIGAGAVHAWVRAKASDVDLQVTISEVRPDGKETYVQSGYLRASRRQLDSRKSTLLKPVLSLRREDIAKLPKGRFSKLIIPLYYQGHMYRAGSRIRVTVSAPVGDQPVWAFAETVPQHNARVTIALSHKRPSRLILPLIPGVSAPTPLPPCPALRGEPCRAFGG
ncbi:MAG TPA: CocE/NonD family hydrolase [Solirubrobacterales bacterium]|nr:CocE/NonD family hydrolase [Solirubrobacterales bacterium]